MRNHRSAQDYYLKKFTVAFRRDVEGTGVIVTDDGLILTCYHIIGNLKNRTLYSKTVDIYLPEGGLSQSADVIEKYCDPSIDVGFLRLQGKLPQLSV
jgi:S1-C subfamily serine protease